MNVDIAKLTVQSLAAKLISGELPLRTYVKSALQHIDSLEPSIQALLPEPDRGERLLHEADDLLATYPSPASRPPLFGILIGIKDLFNVDGLPTQAGSKLPSEAFQGKEAEVVTILKKAGALILGKTVSTEFAYFSPGPTHNPLNLNHTPGGSSSGSAAAVAAGYCPLALGTQTIASIIRPASYCGVYGFKPSWGRISLAGVFPFSQAADHVGFFARSIEDLTFLTYSLYPNYQSPATPPEPRLGGVHGAYLAQTTEQVRKNYSLCLNLLRNKGIDVHEYDLFSDIEEINAVHRKLIAAEFALNHQHFYAKYSHLYSEHSKELYEQGQTVSPSELSALHIWQQNFRHKLNQNMQDLGIDLWITPATTTTAPLGLDSTGSPLMSLPWTNAGFPSLTIPSGFTENGLPYGLQVIAGWQSDEYLLSAANVLDHALSGK
jgi:Asp-tRNA(Asn)/Glu-tRNA(Gln) amidotransferase A subunit family amidase